MFKARIKILVRSLGIEEVRAVRAEMSRRNFHC